MPINWILIALCAFASDIATKEKNLDSKLHTVPFLSAGFKLDEFLEAQNIGKLHKMVQELFSSTVRNAMEVLRSMITHAKCALSLFR